MGIFEDLTKPISQQSDTSDFDFDAYLQEKIKPYKKKTVAPDPTSEFTPEKVDDRIGGILGGLADLVEGGFNSLEPTSANVIATGLEGVNQFASDPIGTVNKLTVGSALRLGGMIGDAVTNGNGYEKMDKWLSENTERGVKLFDPNTSILRDASEGWRQHSKQYSEKNPIPDSFMGELGAGGTSFSMTVVPTVITALATKNPATVAKVAQSLGYALETSSQYQDLLDSGYKPEEAMTGAHTYGIMASILEKQVPEKIAGGLTKDFLKKGYKKLFKEMAERGTLEGFTEVTQDILATSLKWNKMDDKQKEEYLKGLPSQAARTFAVSFILGVAGGLPGDISQVKNERQQLANEIKDAEKKEAELQTQTPQVEEVKLTPEQQLKKVRNDAISAEYKATIKNIDDSKAEIRREVNRLNGELKIAKNDNEIIDEKRISGELAKLKEQLKSLDSQRKTAKEDAIKKIDEVENLKENEPTEGLTQEKSPVDLFNERMKPKEVKLLNARKTSPELPSNATEPNYRTQPLTVEERYDATNEMKLADKIKNLRVKINDPKVKNKKELKAELKRAILQLNEISRAKANKQLNEANFEQQTADLQKLTPTEATEPQTPAKGMEVKAEVKEPVITLNTMIENAYKIKDEGERKRTLDKIFNSDEYKQTIIKLGEQTANSALIVPEGKGSWRKAFNDTKDIFKKKSILRSVIDISKSKEELMDILSVADKMPEQLKEEIIYNARKKIDTITKTPVKEEAKIKGAVKENLTTEQPKQKSMVDVHNEALKLHKSSYGLKDKNKLQRLLSAKAIMDEAGYDRESELYTENDRLINNIKQTLGIKTNETSLPVKEAVRNIEETKYEMRKSKGGWSVDKKENNNWGFVQQFRTKKEAQNYIDSKQKPEVSNVKEEGRKTLLEEKPKTNKEPWEMTNKEVLESIRTKPTLSGNNNSLIGLGKNILTSGMTIEGIPANEIPGWEDVLLNHKKAVQQALSEGKPVPPEVLKDYPELKPSKDRIVEQTGATGTDAPVSKRVFSEEGYKQDRKDASDILNRPNFIGAQLEALPQMLRIAGYHLENVVRAGIEKGRQFTEWTKSMIKDLGGKIRPYLKKIWEETQRQFGKKLLQYAEKNPFIRSMNVVEGSLFANDKVFTHTEKAAKVEKPVITNPFIKARMESVKEIKTGLGKGFKKYVYTLYDMAGEISQRIRGQLYEFEMKSHLAKEKDFLALKDFFDKTKAMDKKVKEALNIYFLRNHSDSQVMQKFGGTELYNSTREVLDNIWHRAKEVGLKVPFKKDYFPRVVKDHNGLAQYLYEKGLTEHPTVLAKKLEGLTDLEAEKYVDGLLRSRNILSEKKGNLLLRTIDDITEDMQKFYHPFDVGLALYIDKVNEQIEAKRWLSGTKKENVNDAINSYVDKELVKEGDLEKIYLMRDIIKARLNPTPMNPFFKGIKFLSQYTGLSQISTSIKQLGSLGTTMAQYGMRSAAKGIINREFTLKDFGLDNQIMSELQSSALRAKQMNSIFRKSGLSMLDAIDKGTYINAAVADFKKRALKNDRGLTEELTGLYGEERANTIIDNLKKNNINDDVKLAIFGEIVSAHAVTQSNMTMGYLSGNSFIKQAYTFMSYTINTLNLIRSKSISNITKGWQTKNYGLVRKGVKNLAKYSFYVALMNDSLNAGIDYLLGEEVQFDIMDSLLNILGVNRFGVEKVWNTKQPYDFIGRMAFKDAGLSSSIIQTAQGNPEHLIKHIPLVGRIIYNNYFKKKR